MVRPTLILHDGDLYTGQQYRALQTSRFQFSMSSFGLGDYALARAVAMSVIAKSCADYRSDTLSAVPLAVNDPSGKPADWHPLTFFIHHAERLLWHVHMSQMVWGRAYLIKEYNLNQYPTGLRWVSPLDVLPQIEPMTERVIGYYIRRQPYTPEQVIPFPLFDPLDPNDGIAPYEMVYGRVLAETHLVNFQTSFFANGARPEGILRATHEMGEEEFEKAQANWKQFKGSDNAFKTFIATGDWEYVPITVSPVDLTMPELKEDQRRDVCIAFRVNPALVGAGDVSDPLSAGATFNGIQRDHIESITIPTLKRILNTLNEQWAWQDFDEQDYYTLAIDRAAMPILSDVTKETITSMAEGTRSNLLDLDEARKSMSLEARGADYLRRDPAQALTVYQGGTISLNRFLELIGEPTLSLIGDIFNLPGIGLVPVSRLLDLANATVDKLILPQSPFNLPFNDPNAAIVSGDAQNLLTTGMTETPNSDVGAEAARDLPSLWVGLYFRNNPDLIALRDTTRERYPDGTEWTLPEDFHITLAYAPNVTDEEAEAARAALADLTLPDLRLRLGSLKAFDTLGKYALHFRIRRNSTLLDLQATVYDALTDAGVSLSSHSNPPQYNPHITMGYVEAKPAGITFNTNVSITPTCLAVSKGEEVIAECTRDGWQDQNAPVQPMADVAPVRSVAAMIALSLTDGQHVRYAQRQFAQRLSDADIRAGEWTQEAEWVIPLAQFDALPASSAAQYIKALDVSDERRLDLMTAGYEVDDDSLYLRLDGGESFARLANIAVLEAEGLSPMQGVTAQARICLARGVGDLDGISLEPANAYPVVADALVLRRGGADTHRWQLRAASSGQLRELKNYRHKVERRGADVAFTSDSLPQAIMDYLRSSLCCADHAGQVFETAERALITGDYTALTPLRAHEDDMDEAERALEAEAREYWQHYDDLAAEVGETWLSAYMANVGTQLGNAEDDALSTREFDLSALLESGHETLVSEWVGTEDAPGPLSKLMLAGMAAGQKALEKNKPAKPTRALNLSVDWTLLARQAVEFARRYAYQLVRNLDATTRQLLSETMATWAESGTPISELRTQLGMLFEDEARGRRIANTEGARVFVEGAHQRYEEAGVSRARWYTVKDARVCPICKGLDGQIADFREGFEYQGKRYRVPAHPECRCYERPELD